MYTTQMYQDIKVIPQPQFHHKETAVSAHEVHVVQNHCIYRMALKGSLKALHLEIL